LQGKLAAMAKLADTAIHGDLVAGNILVDQDARPLAVLDFGFLTTAGDPRLDAAIFAAVATSNAFTPDGSDGHFAWCLTQLGRADITAALGLQLSP
jgi:aminoglycoside phosphotransferase (APT) family kinase protein